MPNLHPTPCHREQDDLRGVRPNRHVERSEQVLLASRTDPPGLEPGHASVTSTPQTESLRIHAADPIQQYEQEMHTDPYPPAEETEPPAWWTGISKRVGRWLLFIGLVVLWRLTGGRP